MLLPNTLYEFARRCRQDTWPWTNAVLLFYDIGILCSIRRRRQTCYNYLWTQWRQPRHRYHHLLEAWARQRRGREAQRSFSGQAADEGWFLLDDPFLPKKDFFFSFLIKSGRGGRRRQPRATPGAGAPSYRSSQVCGRRPSRPRTMTLMNNSKPKAQPKQAGATKSTDKNSTRARRGRSAGRPKRKTAEELDAEMTDYFGGNAPAGADATATTNGNAAGANGGEDLGMDEISVKLPPFSLIRSCPPR
jgi:hypothetical protein